MPLPTGKPEAASVMHGHAVAGVVAPCQQTRARRRAQRRRVPLRVAHAIARDLVDVRGRDRTAVTGHRREPDVIENDVDHVRSSVRRRRRHERRPVFDGVPDIDVDLALETCGHDFPPLRSTPVVTTCPRQRPRESMRRRAGASAPGAPGARIAECARVSPSIATGVTVHGHGRPGRSPAASATDGSTVVSMRDDWRRSFPTRDKHRRRTVRIGR